MFFIKDEDFKDLKEVTSTVLVDQKLGQFHKDGLFSPNIFGSNEYSCECGSLKASWHIGNICEHCGTEVLEPKDNIYRNGKLVIPYGYKVFNPTIYTIIAKYIRKFTSIIDPSLKHVDLNGHIIYDDSRHNFKGINFIDFTLRYKDAINELFEPILSNSDTLENIEEDEDDLDTVNLNDKLSLLKDFLLNNEEYVMLNTIPLLPIHLRPSQLTGNQMQIEPLNKQFILINTHINSLRNNVEVDDLISIEKELFKIQQAYMTLYEDIINIISKKEGIARDNILSNRINLSGRAVISVSHKNNPNYIEMPRIMFTEIYLPKIINKLVNYLGCSHTDASIYYFNNRFNDNDENINNSIEDILLEKPMVLINRNPSLHLLSIQAFYISNVTNDYTIKLPKTCLRSLNGAI